MLLPSVRAAHGCTTFLNDASRVVSYDLQVGKTFILAIVACPGIGKLQGNSGTVLSTLMSTDTWEAGLHLLRRARDILPKLRGSQHALQLLVGRLLHGPCTFLQLAAAPHADATRPRCHLGPLGF